MIETVERLWPDASEVSLVGERRASSTPGSASWELLAVPNATHPRVLLPVGGRAAGAAMQRFSAAVSAREVLERQGLGAGLALGGTRLVRDRIRVVEPGDDHIVAVLAEVMGEPVTVSLGIGTARANRKPVLGVFDRAGHALGFAKIGDSAVAAGHVRGEARALALVGEREWDRVQPPQLLAHRTWRGMEVLVMSALRARPWRGRGSWPIPEAAADEVAGAFDEGRRPLVATPMWQRCVQAAASLTDPTTRDRLTEAMDRVAATVGEDEVRVGGCHGDFTPWNLARRSGRILLWDWERFEQGVPHGMDHVHYAVNTVLRAQGLRPEALQEGLRKGTGRSGSTPRADAALVAAYLVSLSCRYLTAAQGEGGRAVLPRAELTLSALVHSGERLTADAADRGAR